MQAAARRTGGCQCGRLRYAYTGELGDASICHCRMCQKAFGNWGAALVEMQLSSFKFTKGTPAVFHSSSIVKRGFCRECGTPMFMHEDGDANIEIAIGTLDQPNDVPSFTKQSAVESRLDWFVTMHLLKEERMDDYRKADDMLLLKSLQHPDFDT